MLYNCTMRDDYMGCIAQLPSFKAVDQLLNIAGKRTGILLIV